MNTVTYTKVENNVEFSGSQTVVQKNTEIQTVERGGGITPSNNVLDVRYVAESAIVTGARDGTFAKPFATIQDAIDFFGDPVDQADYRETKTIVFLDGSIYTENPVFTTRKYVLVGDNIQIDGDITYQIDGALLYGASGLGASPQFKIINPIENVNQTFDSIKVELASGGTALPSVRRLLITLIGCVADPLAGGITVDDGVIGPDIGNCSIFMNKSVIYKADGQKTTYFLIDSSLIAFSNPIRLGWIQDMDNSLLFGEIVQASTGTILVQDWRNSRISLGCTLDFEQTLTNDLEIDSFTYQQILDNATVTTNTPNWLFSDAAEAVLIQDVGSYYTSDDVEGALQEVGVITSALDTTYARLDATNQPFTGSITIGNGSAGVDYSLTFDGEDNDGVLTWLEDEDNFLFDKRVEITDYFFQDNIGNNALGLDAGASVTTGADNVFLGTDAGTSLTEGANNCFFGRQAGASVTEGSDNWIAGFRAGQNLTTGNQNTLGGSQAGQNLTDGSFNVCLGLSSGKNLGSGSNNVAIGRVSLATYTGSTAVAIGYAALRNTTGTNNLGIGYLAGNDLVAGTFNVLVGISAGQNLDSGSRNLVMGYRSLYHNVGSDNVALSYQALHGVSGVSDFDNCIGVGFEAGFLTETSIGNIYLGREAGYKPNNLVANATTTGSYQNFIGYRAGLGSSTQRDNVTAIGKNAVVDADNTCVIGGQGADAQTLITTGGRQHNTTRLTSGDSPYDVLYTDHEIFCDTDGGAITVNLPAGIDGTNLRIINCGSSGNDVTVTPDGSELLKGANSSQTISDGNTLIITYETTEGWW